MELFAKLRLEQPQRLFRQLRHLFVKGILLQFLLQLSPLFRQFLPTHHIELPLEVRDHQLWCLEKHFQRTAIETKQDGYLLEQTQFALLLGMLLVL